MRAVAFALALLAGFGIAQLAHANHLIYLPYSGQTWMAMVIKANQEQVWCLDSRAESYPGFLSQLRDVNDQYTQRTGIHHRQVAFDDPSCQVRHLMLPEFPCGSGAAACIYYANRPVDVHYQETLGYQDWRSAQGHELGHGILGQLHEQYNDSGGSIFCTGRQDTVMDCGGNPQVRYPQPLDVQRGCAIIVTSWCGPQQPPPPCDPCWNGTEWVFADGWRFRPNADDGQWFDPQGRLVWDDIDEAWDGRYSPVAHGWFQRGHDGSAFIDGYGWLSLVVP